ncbi:MAG: Fe-S cluster assembly protein SufD [Panacagrimonas sp.]
MQQLDNFEQGFASLPEDAKTPPREAALRHLLAKGLPSRKQERWKYTDLGRLNRLPPFTQAPLAASLSASLSESADGIEAINLAFGNQGLDLTVPARAQHDQLLIANGRGHRRHHLTVCEQASAQLRLDTCVSDPFQTVILDIELQAGARLELLRVHEALADAHHITRIRARLARDAQLDVSTLDLGAGWARHELDVDLAAPGASVQYRGFFRVADQSFVDNHSHFDHHAAHCSSRQLMHGMAEEGGRAVFNGKVMVHRDAQKTDSDQKVANLILSPKAEINAKPELEIYADDVKCAHGATFGQIDPTALFYLRSRGLSQAQARSLLTLAFAMQPLRHIPCPDFRQTALRAAAQKLGAEIDETVLT